MKEKLTIGFFTVLLTVTTLAQAQDMITLIDGEEISANVEEVRLQEIAYKKADNPNGPLYIVPKQQIYMIRYANGTKEVYSYTMGAPQPAVNSTQFGTSASPEALYQRGRADANLHFNKKGAMWGTFGTTIIFAPLGLATGIIIGATPPKIEDTVPDYEMLKLPEYKNGYVKKARGKRWGAIATGFGIGIATNLIVFSLVNI